MKNVCKFLLVVAVFPLLIASAFQSTYAQPFLDPVSDLFDANGNSTEAEPYLDILSLDIKKSGADFLIEFVVNGQLPESVDPSLWIEWDIGIDTDSNPNTGWRWPMLYNDIGVDYVIRVGILDSTYYPQIMKTQPKWKEVARPYCDIRDNKVTFTVMSSEGFQLPSKVTWTAAAQKYGKRGEPPNPPLLAADKAPDQGHFSNSVESIATFTIVAAPSELGPPFSDPTDDLFDAKGKVSGDSYVDIVSVDIRRSDGGYLFIMELNGDLPDRIDEAFWIEWDFMIDIDTNPSTGWESALEFNDLGPDYMIRIGILDSTYYAEVHKLVPDGIRYLSGAYYNIKGKILQLELTENMLSEAASQGLKAPSQIAWLVSVRKMGDRGNPPRPPLLAADKAPNRGHYTTFIRYLDAYPLIIKAEEAIRNATLEGRTEGIDEAKGLLVRSKQKLGENSYDEAVQLANKAIEEAYQAQKPATTTREMEPTTQITTQTAAQITTPTPTTDSYMIIGVIAVVGVISIVTLLIRRRKTGSAMGVRTKDHPGA